MRRSHVIIVFLLTLVVAAVAVNRTNSILGLIVTAPGYLVQAWLFERHWALGGAGYRATMITASALFWTLIVVVAARSVSWLAARIFRGRVASQ